MPPPNQTPDDFLCKPAKFIDKLDNGTVEKTFEVRSPWDVVTTYRIGDLVVLETPLGSFVKIREEDDWLRR